MTRLERWWIISPDPVKPVSAWGNNSLVLIGFVVRHWQICTLPWSSFKCKAVDLGKLEDPPPHPHSRFPGKVCTFEKTGPHSQIHTSVLYT